MTVIQAEVEMLRANTEAWIPLSKGAIMSFGVGDRVRTNRTGRGLIQFWDAETLILPESEYELVALEGNHTGVVTLHGRASGRSIHYVPAPEAFDRYLLEAGYLTLVKPSQQLGVQSVPDSVDYLVVAEGEAEVLLEGGQITVHDNEGLRMSGNSPDPLVSISEDAPINFARIEAELDGCEGEVQTAGDVALRVRAGPGNEYFYMGSIADGTPVQIMGFAFGPGGMWYRFQFLSDFGWGLGTAFETTCNDLPQYPTQGVENAAGIVQVNDFELALLTPFFGLPADDVWFYRR